ncbi:MAG: CsbD family protein [Candidatus Dormibacteria bacterium]
MGELKNKVEGSIKEGAGKVTGNDDLEARGAGQKTVGDAQEGARKVGGKVEETIGKVTGNEGKEAEGKVRQA